MSSAPDPDPNLIAGARRTRRGAWPKVCWAGVAAAFAGALLLATPATACQMMPVIYFRHGGAEIDAQGRAGLLDFAQQGIRRLDVLEGVAIVGHSDRTGPMAARRRVGLRRAEAVKALLMSFGLPAHLLHTSSAADSRPAIEMPEEVREPQNRRVELTATLGAASATDGLAPRC